VIILHISTRLILGGSQENTVLSCEGQSRLGHQVHLAFGPIYGPEGSLLARVQQFRTPDGRSITTHTVPDLIREVNPSRDLRCLRQLGHLIESIRPDVIHTHSSKAGILGRLAGWSVYRRSRRREGPARAFPAVIHTVHGPPFMPIEGPLVRRLKTRVNNAIYQIAERHAARRCHAIVCVADEMTRQFLARGIGSRELYTTVRSGMDTGPYLNPPEADSRENVRAELGIGPGDFVIGTVARLAEHKGHDDLIDALAPELQQRREWKLLWVGDGWWRERLLARVRSLGLEGQVLTTGLVPPERVPALIRAMDVLAHPSYREGLPRTVPQALLSDVCPVAYDVDGTREACVHRETGLLAPFGDRAALHAAILELYRDPDLRRRLAAEGKVRCATSFSAEAMVQGLETVYSRALATARR
jgi:glycosyltransferase involved in cell wall biosynthesis